MASFACVISNQFAQVFSPYILLKEVSFLSFMLNFDNKNDPKNLREGFPYLTVFTL